MIVCHFYDGKLQLKFSQLHMKRLPVINSQHVLFYLKVEVEL